MVALKVSTQGLAIIKQARKAKGWTVDDCRWLEEASIILGTSWQERGYFADGISEGTWKRFLSGKYAINVDAFKAFSQVLGIEWQEIIDRNNYQDWGEEIDVSIFCGRGAELDILNKYIIKDRCRLVTLLGMGGIGKTALSIKAAHLIENKFEFIIWRSLRNTPSLEKILVDLIQFLSRQKQINLPESLEQKISLLLQYLRSSRCLLILDNVESILQSNNHKSPNSLIVKYRTGYENYGNLFKAIAQIQHQSCLILTSREPPPEFSALEGENLPVRCLQLKGLSKVEVQKILGYKGTFSGSETEWKILVKRYGGNPLALKIVAFAIQDFFNGSITDFIKILQQDTFIFDDIRELLQQQFQRLTGLEQQIMYWLTINREPVSIQNLQQDFVAKVPVAELIKSLASLQKRSLIEKFDNFFSQQTVVMEYITHDLIVKATEEIETNKINFLNQIALAKSQSKDFIRQSQETQIIKPVGERLLDFFGTNQNINKQIQVILQTLYSGKNRTLKRGYLSGNLINLLRQLEIDLSGYNFSGLTVWQANLQGIKLHNVNFANADLSKSIFTETLGNILSATFSPDGKTLATCDTDCQIRLWEVETGKLLVICKGHNNWVRSVSFSPDGQTLVSGGADRTVKFWQVSDGTCLKTCRGHDKEIFSVTYSPIARTVVSASGDNILRIWDAITGECIKTLIGHDGWVRSVSFSPDGKLLASGSDDRTVRIWDAITGECLRTLVGHDGWVRSVSFSRDGVTLASGSGDSTVKLWDVNTGECLTTYDRHTAGVSAVAFNSDGVTLASGSCDRTVRLWNYRTHTCIRTIYGHANQIFSLAFSPDGQTIVCVSLDQTVRIWDCQDGKCLKTWQGSTDWVFPVAFNPQGNLIASGSNDYTIRIWDWENNACIRILFGHKDYVCAVAFHPHHQILASASRDRTIRLWDVTTGNCLKILQGHQDWLYSVAFSPDGKIIASGGADKTARLWDLETGKCLQTFSEHTDQVWSVAFSPDGNILATGNTDRMVRLWDVATGKLLDALTGHDNRIKSVAFSPVSPLSKGGLKSDRRVGGILASGSTDNAIAIWDYQQGQLIQTLQGHDNWVFSVAFSPEGQTLASASHDQTVRLWNIETGEYLHICRGHNHLVSSVAFHPHGQIVASGSQDQTVRLWQVKTGTCLRVLQASRLYEGMNITGTKGLTSAQKTTLKILGAREY
ncbi:WD-repeat protein (plasmid) [Stanieria sp. NIES-3757]|nr:WD-repeat protein [Stanieria sp. NIES-3757]